MVQGLPPGGAMKGVLRKAERVLGNASQLLELDLPRQGDRSMSKRGVTWLKSRDKFAAANAELRELQISLLLACSINPISQSPQTVAGSRVSPSNLLTGSNHDADIKTAENEGPDDRSDLNAPGDSERPASPASLFELSAEFMPELYTVDEKFPTLFSDSAIQLSMSEYSMTNLYTMFYRTTGRRWSRISLTVTISIESSLFEIERLSPLMMHSRKPLVPITLELLRFMEAQEDPRPYMYLRLYVGGHFMNQSAPTSAALVKFSQPPQTERSVTEQLQDATSVFYHANCPFIPETHVTQMPFPERPGGFFFLSQYQSEWMLDFRFTMATETNDSLLYQLKALHRLRGRPGICQLVGVVTGRDDGIMKGFLVRLPPNGFLLTQIHSLTRHRTPIPWERRERWCRGVVRAVASAHAERLLVGFLGGAGFAGFCISEDDDFVMYSFRRFYMLSKSGTAMVAPEHQEMAASPRKNGTLPSTPHTDIFQLGLTLWLIASSKANDDGDARERSNSLGKWCLPSLGGDVPGYMNEMIATCRSEDPLSRKAAWSLLQMFPPESETLERSRRQSLPHASVANGCDGSVTELRRYRELYSGWNTCDDCHKRVVGIFYSCSVCHEGSFDLCSACFSKGRHCLDASHYLAETRLDGASLSTFFSDVKGGKREVLDLNHLSN